MNGRDSSVATGQSHDCAPDRNAECNPLERQPQGGILGRAIRNQQLWLTLGYFAVLLLLARAYT